MGSLCLRWAVAWPVGHWAGGPPSTCTNAWFPVAGIRSGGPRARGRSGLWSHMGVHCPSPGEGILLSGRDREPHGIEREQGAGNKFKGRLGPAQSAPRICPQNQPMGGLVWLGEWRPSLWGVWRPSLLSERPPTRKGEGARSPPSSLKAPRLAPTPAPRPQGPQTLSKQAPPLLARDT